jgi:ADP-ribose pyrophosphatase YjhB (NUDIX family)
MEEYKCIHNCCVIKHKEYKSTPIKFYNRRHKKKAGVFIYDPNKKSILLVQSKGNLWGPPKGTFENEENSVDCAIREVLEETGILLSKSTLQTKITIKSQATYFYVEMDECDVKVQDITNNDANSITWIKTKCLLEMIKHKKIILTQHCRILLNQFLNITFM